MNREQFEFALQNLNSTHWQWFEELAAEFLIDEFPGIRTTACVHGDRGRDGYLMSDEADASVVFQYSVTEGFERKIRDTARVLKDHFPDTQWLVYLTNQRIGADADNIRAALRKDFGLALDVRDISYFLDRRHEAGSREAASLELFDRVAKPILESRNFYESRGLALDTVAQKTILVHLGLQYADEAGNRNLTKFAYQALVRTALLGTDIDNRRSREDVYAYVASVVPDVENSVLVARVDAALKKMDKVYVRHWRKTDEFQLTHEETERINLRLAETSVDSSRLDDEIAEALACVVANMDDDEPPLPDRDVMVPLTRTVIEQLLLHRGESVIAAVREDGVYTFVPEDIEAMARRAAERIRLVDPRVPSVTAEVLRIANGPGRKAAAAYMRRLADSYTLLAFLRATPDIQKAVRAVYSRGDLWLDTNIVLRLLAETLVDEERRLFTRTLAAARDAGLKLHVTEEVLEEVLHHLEHALLCARTPTSEWRSAVPFLLAEWVGSGRARDAFGKWLHEFRGSEDPFFDLAEYLSEVHDIHRDDLDHEGALVDDDVRIAVHEAWLQVHETRRAVPGDASNTGSAQVLAQRDTNAYLGILGHRESRRDSFLGYTSWWLTSDHSAYWIHERVERDIRRKIGRPPTMSPDFLTTYLAIRPVGHEVLPATSLPVILDMGHSSVTPPEFLEHAEDVRKSMEGQDERLIRRGVRDELERARCRLAIPEMPEVEESAEEEATRS